MKYREFMVITSKSTSSIDVYFTSEENSYGIFKKEWFDGKVFERNIKPGHQVKVYLEPREYTYLNHDGQCSPKTFLEQWRPYLQASNFSKCPCSFYPFLATDEIEFCGWKVTLDAVRSTDLGSLIGKTQCGNFRNFLPLRIYVKSILVILKLEQLPF